MTMILTDKGGVKALRIHTRLEGCSCMYSKGELKHRANADYVSTALAMGHNKQSCSEAQIDNL